MFAGCRRGTCAGAFLVSVRGRGTENLHLQRETGHFALLWSAIPARWAPAPSPMASGKPATSHADDVPRAGASSPGAVRHKRTSPLDSPVRNFPHEPRRQVYWRGTAPSVAFATAIRAAAKSFVNGISRVARER